MNLRLPIQRRLFLSHFLAVVLVSGSVGTYFYMSAVSSLLNNLRSRLENSAALVGRVIDARDLDEVRTEEDIQNPHYIRYLDLLRTFKRSNKDIAFLYVMRLEGDRVTFVVDSDETEAQALPGREYEEVIPELHEGFSRPSVDESITTDEWGSFMSGYSPIVNGAGAYLVGLDMRADEVSRKLRHIRISGILSFCGSLLLAFLFSRILSSHFMNPIQLLIQRCGAIADGQLDEQVEARTGDEFDNLIHGFNSMSQHLISSREENHRVKQDLISARDTLEQRVEERTRDLTELNTKLRHEISERERIEEALAHAARTDALTGLLNRRAIIEYLDQQMVRHKRSGEPFVVMLSDIDHFKRVNDTYGHDIGDQVLRNVAHMLRTSVRELDLVARWGGEEFLMVLPDTDLEGGIRVAEKLRHALTGAIFPDGLKDLELTLSIGLTPFIAGQSIDDCIKAADTAMYEAKRLGRDRVVSTR